MTRHTPGPWAAEEGLSDAITVRAAERRPIAEMWVNGHDVKANSALVAAAPELLAVLNEIIASSDAYDETEGAGERCYAAVEAAKKVVAKAEGR